MPLVEINPIVLMLIYSYVAILILIIITDNRSSQSTLGWVIVLITLPVIGIVLYFFVGRNWRISSLRKIKEKQHVETSLEKKVPYLNEIFKRKIPDPKYLEGHSQNTELSTLFMKNSNSILTRLNKVEIIKSGKDKFDKLLEDLRNAKRFIHLEYYIWRSDRLTKEIHRVLIEKSKQGVEVRLICDALGSLSFNLKDKSTLKKAGVKIHVFSNRLLTLNYRNHRKIVVIDGEIGYIGGMNVGQEYIDGGKRFPYWRDTHLRCEGEVTNILQSIFISDWFHATKEELFSKDYFKKSPIKESLPMQIVTSGPDSKWESIHQMYFSLINSVDKYVYIQTPYFIPDKSIEDALRTAALRGLDVRLMVTGLLDSKVSYYAAFTYFERLLNSGVKIYLYKKGLLHSKTMVIDDQICSIGTANMDMRSFNLNYELNAVIYDEKKSIELKKDFLQDMKFCDEFTLDDYKKIGKGKRLRNSVAKILEPLL